GCEREGGETETNPAGCRKFFDNSEMGQKLASRASRVAELIAMEQVTPHSPSMRGPRTLTTPPPLAEGHITLRKQASYDASGSPRRSRRGRIEALICHSGKRWLKRFSTAFTPWPH